MLKASKVLGASQLWARPGVPLSSTDVHLFLVAQVYFSCPLRGDTAVPNSSRLFEGRIGGALARNNKRAYFKVGACGPLLGVSGVGSARSRLDLLRKREYVRCVCSASLSLFVDSITSNRRGDSIRGRSSCEPKG